MKFITLIAGLLLACITPALEAKWRPDFIIIGAQKSGTTPLYFFIKQHPQVVYKKGEVHFFDLMFHKGTGWYRKRFTPRPTHDHLIGDKSPYYMLHPLVPKRVHDLYPHVKIVAILRNPVDRAYSHYWHNVRAGRETLSFEEAILAEPERLKGERRKTIHDPYHRGENYRHFSYLERGNYVKHLKHWLKYFPREQIFIISSSELRIKPEVVMNDLFAFLGVPGQTLPKYKNRSHNYEPMAPQIRQQLVEYFKPYNKQLEELLGRKFDWDK
ncbi:MAG: sulfotransferase domain-containing protein [Parachlamydia sp.]|nr:sulfotransferase domain-containing protein [Parachlamydia sp.]